MNFICDMHIPNEFIFNIWRRFIFILNMDQTVFFSIAIYRDIYESKYFFLFLFIKQCLINPMKIIIKVQLMK